LDDWKFCALNALFIPVLLPDICLSACLKKFIVSFLALKLLIVLTLMGFKTELLLQ